MPGLLTRTRLPPRGSSPVREGRHWRCLPVTDPGVFLGPSRPLLPSGLCSVVPPGSRQPSVPPPPALSPPLCSFSLCFWALCGPDPTTCCCCRSPCLAWTGPQGARSQGSLSGSLWTESGAVEASGPLRTGHTRPGAWGLLSAARARWPSPSVLTREGCDVCPWPRVVTASA